MNDLIETENKNLLPSIGKMDIIEAEKLEKELIFDYRIPLNVTFTVNKIHEDCVICKNEIILNYIAPFIVTNVPELKIIRLIKLRFDIFICGDDIEKHKEHIICDVYTDKSVQENALQDIALIESDIVQKIDCAKVIESQIRQLHAMQLSAKKEDDVETVLQCSRQLQQWVKMKTDISGGSDGGDIAPLIVGDVINIGNVGDITKYDGDNDRNKKSDTIDVLGEIFETDAKRDTRKNRIEL